MLMSGPVLPAVTCRAVFLYLYVYLYLYVDKANTGVLVSYKGVIFSIFSTVPHTY